MRVGDLKKKLKIILKEMGKCVGSILLTIMEIQFKMMSGNILTIHIQSSDPIETIYQKIFEALPEDIQSDPSISILNLRLIELDGHSPDESFFYWNDAGTYYMNAINEGKQLGVLIEPNVLRQIVYFDGDYHIQEKHKYVDCEGRIYYSLDLAVHEKSDSDRCLNWFPSIVFYEKDGLPHFVGVNNNTWMAYIPSPMYIFDPSICWKSPVDDSTMHLLIRRPAEYDTCIHETDLMKHFQKYDSFYNTEYEVETRAYIASIWRKEFAVWYTEFQKRDRHDEACHEYFHGPNETLRENHRTKTNELHDKWRQDEEKRKKREKQRQ